MKEKLLLLTTFTLIFLNVGYSQNIATDSKNKGVFTYYSTKEYRMEFSSEDFSVTFATLPILKEFVIGDTTNVEKKSNFYFQPSLINASEILSLSDFSNFRPGGKVKLGYQTTVDSIYATSNGYTFSAGLNVFGSIDNIKLYNTDKSIIEKRYPFSVGTEANYTQFLPLKWMVLSLTGTVSYGWNDDDLLNFKDISSGSKVNGNIVAFEDFDGKYGTIATGVYKGRVSLSAPISIWYLNPIPYVVVVATTENSPRYFAGLYTNILSKRINFHGFKLPSTFGIGFDKIWDGDKWSKTNVFVRGSINFSEF